MKYFNRFNTTISIITGLITILAFVFGIQKCSDLALTAKTSKILEVREMSFRVTECTDSKFPEGNLTGFYDIEFEQEGTQIRGTGYKHSERFHGKFMRYSKNFEIDIVGEIKQGELIAKVYEDNGKKTHKIEGVLRLNLKTLKGTMTTNFFNCAGLIEMR